LGLSKDFIEFSHLNWSKIFYYIGLIQSGIRTPQILTDIIRYYFDLDDVSIEEHVRQLVEIESEQKNKLGMQNMMLGNNFISGDKIESFSNKFRVNIDNLKLNEFYQFLPNTEKYNIFKN
jgi:type VI secretion protein, VC_A0110 family